MPLWLRYASAPAHAPAEEFKNETGARGDHAAATSAHCAYHSAPGYISSTHLDPALFHCFQIRQRVRTAECRYHANQQTRVQKAKLLAKAY